MTKYIEKVYCIFIFLLGAFVPSNAAEVVSINQDWAFVKVYGYNMNKNPDWKKVNLPHTWNAEDVKDGKKDYFRGTGVYRKTFEVKEYGKRYFLRFEGSALVTDVYVNAQFVGKHKGGYTAFVYEITDQVKIGDDNEITVYVSNAFDTGVLPLIGDFNVYGGIHRPVHLLVTNQTCHAYDKYGAEAIRIHQTKVSRKSAVLHLEGEISSESNIDSLQLKITISDANMSIVRCVEQKIDLSITGITCWNQRLELSDPKLWQGVKNPYLYKVKVELWNNAQLLDSSVKPLGVRYFDLHPEKGFFLNGEYLDLRGVCYHEAKPDKGSALVVSDYDEDFELMLAMGVNTIRTAHYPHSEYFYSKCDSLGIIVYTEIPMVGPGGYLGRGFMANEELKENGRQHLRELIRQNINHPSIAFWGLYNELKINGDDPFEYVSSLNKIAKAEDPYRFTMSATFQDNHNNHISDAYGWNRYFGWYSDKPQDLEVWIDHEHANNPLRPLAISEYGAGASIHHHTDSLVLPVSSGSWHPEEWQAHFHEENWKILVDRPFVWGKYIWLMFDFGAAHRSEGDTNGVNDKGIVSADRQKPKDAYYFYKSVWTNEPMLHLCSKRFNKRTIAQAQLKAYSNQPKVKFVVNGKTIAIIKTENGVALGPKVTLQKGNNTIEVKAAKLRDSATWVLE